MHDVQQWRTAVTRSVPGTVVLLAALLVHLALGIAKIAQRRTLRMPWWEALQILAALAIPFLLLPHIVNTRVAHTVFAVDDSYAYELARLWPGRAVVQITLLLLVWGHSCIGLHYWLRSGTLYQRIAPVLLLAAVAVPAVAIAGFVVSAQMTAEILSEPGALEALKRRSNWPDAVANARLASIGEWARWAFLVPLAGLIVLFVLYRRQAERSDADANEMSSSEATAGTYALSFVDGPSLRVPLGMTVLEASRSVGMSHAAQCGGRARCATCRVRIVKGAEKLPAPARAEAAVLAVEVSPAHVRLACQLRPTSALTIEVLVHPEELQPSPVEFTEVKAIVRAHVRAVRSGMLVDVKSDDHRRLDAWMLAKLADLPPAIELNQLGFELLGARTEHLANRACVAVAYTRLGEPVTLFIVPLRSSGAITLNGELDGYRVLGWSDDSYAYFAAAKLPMGELERIEDVVGNQSSEVILSRGGRSELVILDELEEIELARAAGGSTQTNGAP